jgi:hypothetical protein
MGKRINRVKRINRRAFVGAASLISRVEAMLFCLAMEQYLPKKDDTIKT